MSHIILIDSSDFASISTDRSGPFTVITTGTLKGMFSTYQNVTLVANLRSMNSKFNLENDLLLPTFKHSGVR